MQRGVFKIEPESPVVSTFCGEVRGRTIQTLGGQTFYSFVHIPYAAAPTGRLRFALPQPCPSWTMPLNCCGENSLRRCLYKDETFGSYSGSEDCLHLNVATPKIGRPADLPVVVWFPDHPTKEPIEPAAFVEENIVLVTVGFRQGPLGFFSLGIPGAQGNQGLHDQAKALGWVQTTIGLFGGNPDNVTIMGHGPWAMGCLLHLVSPISNSFFQRIIVMSGNATGPLFTGASSDAAQTLAQRFQQQPLEQQLLRLQDLPAKDIVNKAYRSGFGPWGPIVDADSELPFLPKPFDDLIKSGNYNKNVSILAGTSNADGLIVAQEFHKSRQAWRSLTNDHRLKTFLSEALGEQKLLDSFSWTSRARLESLCRRLYFEAPLSQELKLLATHRVLMYKYSFGYAGTSSKTDEYSLSWWKLVLNKLTRMTCFGFRMFKASSFGGACYGDILTYLFSEKQSLSNLNDLAVRKSVVKYFLNFAKTGNPNERGYVHWSRFTKDEILVIDVQPSLQLEQPIILEIAS